MENIETHVDKDCGAKHQRNEINPKYFCLYLAIRARYVQLDVIDSFRRKLWPPDRQTCFLLTAVFLQLLRQAQLFVFELISAAKDKKEETLVLNLFSQQINLA